MIRLRPATPADVPALGRLTHRCDLTQRDWAGEDLPLPTIVEQEAEWHARLARAGSWAVIAGDTGGSVVGACSFAAARESPREGALVPGLAHINAVFVDPDHWRRGIARMLLSAAEEAMRDRGYVRARLFTLEGSPAERLYEAAGWTRTDRREPYPPMGIMTVMYLRELGPRA